MNQTFARVMVKLNRVMWWVMLLTIPLDIFAVFFYSYMAVQLQVPQFKSLALFSLIWAAVKLTYCWLNRTGK